MGSPWKNSWRSRSLTGWQTDHHARNPQKKGSSPNSGESGADFEEEVGVTAEAVGHALDDFDLIVDTFDEVGAERPAGVGELGARGEFEYRYDMGDVWRHRIVIESLPTDGDVRDLFLPICLAGENACPLDDVGGPPGYALFLEILGDRQHEQHEDMLRWIGGMFDPKGFDLNRLNREFMGAKGRRR